VSAKSNYNYEKPFVYLLKNIFQKNDLKLMQQVALRPKEINVTDEMLRAQNETLEVAKNTALPSDDDEDL